MTETATKKKRLNSGHEPEHIESILLETEDLCAGCDELHSWRLADVGGDEFKLYAPDGAHGTANFKLPVRGMGFGPGSGPTKLKKEHPDLYAAVKDIIADIKGATLDPADDPYGDGAVARGFGRTQAQQWAKVMVRCRWQYLEQSVLRSKHPDREEVETEVRRWHDGTFKQEITEPLLKEAVAYIRAGTQYVNEEAMEQLAEAFYGVRTGNKRPYAKQDQHTWLNFQLNYLSGADASVEPPRAGSEAGGFAEPAVMYNLLGDPSKVTEDFEVDSDDLNDLL